MKKWNKIILPLAVLLLLALSISACAKATPTSAPPSGGNEGAAPTTAPETAPTTAPETEPTTAPEEPTTAPPAEEGAAVTANQVQQLLADAFNTANRELALWNIQPGLGTVMMEYGYRIALTNLAAQAGDWGMAQYQLKEATEIQEVGEVTRPNNADLLKNFEHTYLDQLASDIQAKDLDAFNTDLPKTIDGCNACHEATGHPYVRVQAPTASPMDILNLQASDPAEPGEPSEHPAAAPAGDTPLTWPELVQMVNDTFNVVDRSLALWNIQPGLGTVMMEYGHRFALAKYAVDEGNWGMAQYQIKEATEIQEVGEVTRPNNADLLKNFEHSYLDTLVQDIQNKDQAAFDSDYATTMEGCNACHEATGHPYVRIQAPSTMPEGYILAMQASDPTPPGEEKSSETTEPSYPSTPPTLADAQQLITDRMNNVDRALAMWAIQPGLGTVMMEYGYRYAMTWYAAEAGDWGMAQYQLKEATEIQEVGEVTRPNNADLLKNFEHTYLDPIADAILKQDLDAFKSSYTAAIDGCNACHEATGHPYVHVSGPSAVPVDYLQFAPSDATQP